MPAKLFHNCRIYTPADSGGPARGREQGNVTLFRHGVLLVENDLITAVGEEHEVLSRVDKSLVDMEIDCQDRCMVPGFVDPHTHICFAERREGEFEMRIAGTPYLDILKQGGGILSSVKAVKAATEDDLHDNCLRHALAALSFGTTTLEIASQRKKYY